MAALQAGVVLPQEPLLVVEHQRRVLAPVRDRVLLPDDAVQLQNGRDARLRDPLSGFGLVSRC